MTAFLVALERFAAHLSICDLLALLRAWWALS